MRAASLDFSGARLASFVPGEAERGLPPIGEMAESGVSPMTAAGWSEGDGILQK